VLHFVCHSQVFEEVCCSVVHVHTWFGTYTLCKCKNKFIYIILRGPIKLYIYIYMILHGSVKQC